MANKIKGKIGWVKSTHFLAIFTLFFSSLFFFYDLLGGRYILTERDLGPYFIPPRFFWVESIKNGHFPLWNSYLFSGYPFFANPQHAVLYPLNALFFLLPFDLAFNAIIILHFFLGGLFTYLFLKDLKANVTGALISSLIFMLSGYLLSVHSLLTILLSVIWTPLIMMFFRRAILTPGLKNEILTALFMTISFLGGGVEIVYGNFFVLLFMMIFSSLPVYKFPKWKRIWLGVRSLLIVSILFLFLSAIQLFPFLELFRHSIRGNGISYHEATVWSFAPKDILLFFLPDAYGYFLDMKKYWVNQCWFKTLYMGGLPFILSLIFFLFGRHVEKPLCGLPNRAATEGRPYKIYLFWNGRRFYLFLMLFSLFLSLGHYNPLYPFVFKYVPFFNGIRYPAKFLYIFILVLAISAGLGFQRLTEFSKENEEKILKNLFIVLSLTSGLLLLAFILGHKEIEYFLSLRKIDFPDFNRLPVNLYHVKRFLFYLTVFFLLLRIGDEVRWKGWAKVLLIFFLTADLFGNMGFYGKEKTSDYFQKTKGQGKISSDQGHFRIFSTGKTIAMDTPILVANPLPLEILKEKHLPSLNMLHQLYDIWGIDVIRLKRTDDLYRAFTGTPSISTTNLLDLYGVKYVISVTPIQKDPRFELIYSRIEGLQGKKEDLLKENTIKLYRARNHFPRAWLVKNFKVLDANTILLRMLTKEFHPDQEVLLEEEPKWEIGMGGRRKPLLQNISGVGKPIVPACGRQGLPDKVEFILEENNKLHLLVRTKENALLVLSDTYYTGWKAFVYPVRKDGALTPPSISNEHFLSTSPPSMVGLSNGVNLVDPFDGAKPRLSRQDKGAPLRVNPEQAPAFRLGSRRVDTNLSNRVDGKEIKIYKADYNFRAIPLQAGEYEIKFIYDPISFKIGMLVSLLTLIGIVVYFIKSRLHKIKFLFKDAETSSA